MKRATRFAIGSVVYDKRRRITEAMATSIDNHTPLAPDAVRRLC